MLDASSLRTRLRFLRGAFARAALDAGVAAIAAASASASSSSSSSSSTCSPSLGSVSLSWAAEVGVAEVFSADSVDDTEEVAVAGVVEVAVAGVEVVAAAGEEVVAASGEEILDAEVEAFAGVSLDLAEDAAAGLMPGGFSALFTVHSRIDWP